MWTVKALQCLSLQVVLALLRRLGLLERPSAPLVPELHPPATVTAVMVDWDINHFHRCIKDAHWQPSSTDDHFAIAATAVDPLPQKTAGVLFCQCFLWWSHTCCTVSIWHGVLHCIRTYCTFLWAPCKERQWSSLFSTALVPCGWICTFCFGFTAPASIHDPAGQATHWKIRNCWDNGS